MRKTLLGALALFLSGCVVIGQMTAEEGRKRLAGKSRSQVLACLGVPNATFRDGGTEFFAYAGSGITRERSNLTYLGDGVFVGSARSRQAQCVVTLAFRGGNVANVHYRSSGGALIAPDEACGWVVRSCL